MKVHIMQFIKTVNKGGDYAEMLDESLMRIFLWKLKLGIDIGIN